MRSGVILAGGRSARFGEDDKAVADLAGVPMIRRVADRIVETVDELVVNCRPAQVTEIRAAMEGYPLEVSYALDEEADLGPVAGIRNGLRAASGTYALVVACDMPFIEPAFVESLFERVGSADAAIPRLDSGWYQPTQAVYRVDPMIAACESALETENPRVLAAIDRLEKTVVIEESEIETVASVGSFENINTREELAAAEKRI